MVRNRPIYATKAKRYSSQRVLEMMLGIVGVGSPGRHGHETKARLMISEGYLPKP